MNRSGMTLGGRYHLGEKIGTGGMSDVYAATDELLGRDVALKIMRSDLARDTTFLERFRREAQNAAKLNHHSIVSVYDTGQTPPEDGSVPYIVMERVQGETLRDLVNNRGPLPLPKAASVMVEVCQALNFSHEAGIIHRDIKPANIMISNTGAVKVMDFGIARALSDSSAMTQTSSVIGTAQYLSPEQARGKTADTRSDLYASGCVFYELVTGRPPFEGDSPFAVAFQHVQADVTPPSEVLKSQDVSLPDIDAISLDAVTLTAMAKDPEDRYDSIQDFATDLHRLVQGEIPIAAQVHMAEASSPATSSSRGTHNSHTASPAAADTTVLPRYASSSTRTTSSVDLQNREAQDLPMPPAPPALDDYEDDVSESQSTAKRTIAFWLVGLLLFSAAVAGIVFWAGSEEERPAPDQTPAVKEQENKDSNDQVSIPDIKNILRAQAEKQLTDAGLKVQVQERPDAQIVKGYSIGTEPAALSTVPQGSEVTLLVSTGKETTQIPNLQGLTTEEATQRLRSVDLKLDTTVKEESSDTVPAGQIISQSPAAGTDIAKGSVVSITVSTGVEQVRVPVVTGQSLEAARSNLESAGFKVDVVMVDSEKPANEVVRASHEGNNLDKGSTVALEVSRGNIFAMPNVQGRSEGEARAMLQALGWSGTLTTDRTVTTDLGQIGNVATQNPAPGQKIAKSAPVVISVYRLPFL